MKDETNATFTPGPWEVDANDSPRYYPRVFLGPSLPYPDGSGCSRASISVNCGPSRQMVAEGWARGTTIETTLANARLIAAAPDLYAALRAWEHWYSVDSEEYARDEAREMGLVALAKARGAALEVEGE